MEKKDDFAQEISVLKILFDTNEDSLGNATNGFIRKYVFLIREGWVVGVQS